MHTTIIAEETTQRHANPNDYTSNYISTEDANTLKEILAQDEKGEIEYLSEEEFKRHKRELLKGLGVDAN